LTPVRLLFYRHIASVGFIAANIAAITCIGLENTRFGEDDLPTSGCM
jgi:hypothetical protein